MPDVRVIQVGIAAPEFILPSLAGTSIKLSDFRDQKNVVLFFMRTFRCPACRTFAAQLVTLSPEIEKRDAVTLIVGPGSQNEAEQLNKILKADPAHILYDENHAAYDAYFLERIFFLLIQQSAAFVIDKQGVVRIGFVSGPPLGWTNPDRLKQITQTLDGINLRPMAQPAPEMSAPVSGA